MTCDESRGKLQASKGTPNHGAHHATVTPEIAFTWTRADD